MTRFFLMRSIVSIATLLCMLVSAGGAATAAHGPGSVVCDELSQVALLDQIRIDVHQLQYCAATGAPVTLTFSGITISFCLISSDLDLPPAGSDPRTYAGVGSGVSLLRATLTSEWVRISFILNGKDFSIEPIDGTGASGIYAVYSSDDVRISTSYANDAVADPIADKDYGNGTGTVLGRHCGRAFRFFA